MNLIIFFLLLVYTFVLIHICPPTVTIGDVAELTGASVTLGIAHSPGYPLFCNLYKVFTFVFPLGDYGYRTALGSILLFAGSTFLVFLLLKKVVNNQIAIFGLTFIVSQEVLLRQSIVGEVFALHNFIFVLILFVAFNESLSFEKRLYLVAFLIGLSFGNQHITIFYIPAVVVWFIYLIKRDKHKLTLKNFCLTILLFLVGILIYTYVPVRSFKEPLYDWEDAETIERAFYLFTRGRYGTLSLAQGGKLSFDLVQFFSAIKIYLHILGLRNIIFVTVAIIFWIFRSRTLEKFIYGLIFVLVIFFSGIFLISMTGLTSVTYGNIYILERLITVTFFALSIFISYSLKDILKNKIIFLCLALFNFFYTVKNLEFNNQRKNFFLYDYTMNIFHNIPYNSILFSDRADETEFSIAYYQRLLSKRTDVKFIDCNASVTRSIYGDDYYKIWGKPRLEIRNKVEMEIVNKSTNTVLYNTVLPGQTIIKKYKFGLLYHTKSIETVIPHKIYVLRNEPKHFLPREYGLYITHLELISQYYFDLSLKDKKFFDVSKNYYTKLFLETQNPRFLSFIGYYYFLVGSFNSAAAVYEKILKYSIDKTLYVETTVNLGVVYEKMNRFNDSELWYKKALQVDPDYKIAYYNLGSLYMKLGKKEDAISSFKKYLELEPQDKYIQNVLKNLMSQK